MIGDIVFVIVGLLGPVILPLVLVYQYGRRHGWGMREYGFVCVPIVLLWGWFYGKFVFKISDGPLIQGLALIAFQGIMLFWSQHVIAMRRKQREAEKTNEYTGENRSTR